MNALLRLVSLNAARLLFVGALLLTLYVSLTWALAVEDRPDAASIAEAEALREQQESELAAGIASSEDTGAVATPTAATSDGPTPVATVDPQELIALAEAPPETSVQILDAGGGGIAVDAVESALAAIGYDVVAINDSSRDVSATTVYYTGANQPQAEGLRARDPRFQVVEANQGLSDGVDIHVLVGPNF